MAMKTHYGTGTAQHSTTQHSTAQCGAGDAATCAVPVAILEDKSGEHGDGGWKAKALGTPVWSQGNTTIIPNNARGPTP